MINHGGITHAKSVSRRTHGGIDSPYQYRYKLVIIAGDETGDTEFVIFGRIAQRLIKKTVDTLIADNPQDFIPDEITRMLERVFVLNVSFTENTITSGNVSFQVNELVAEIDDGNILPVTPAGSQTSSVMLSQGASSSMQNTPQKGTTFALPSPPNTSEASHASSTTPCRPTQHDPEPLATPQSVKTAAKDKTDNRLASSPLEETPKLVGTSTACSKSLEASHDNEKVIAWQ